MIEEDALEAVRSARLWLEALCLIGPDDYREPCFQELLCQTLGWVAAELREAHDVLEVRAMRGR